MKFYLTPNKDEMLYLKAMADEQQRASDKAANEKKVFLNRRKENYDILNKQMQEKELERVAKRKQEEEIGKQLIEQANKLHREQEENRRQERLRKQEYFKDLNQQISLNKKKKSYSVLMTDFERRVNDKDMKAYENVDTKHLYSLVPGFNSYNQQEDYIDKSMNLNNDQNIQIGKARNNDVNSDEPTAANPNYKPQLSNTPLRHKGIGLKKDQSNQESSFHYSPHKIEKIKRNMELVDRDNYRASTINKSYGHIGLNI